MKKEQLTRLLTAVQNGSMSIDEAEKSFIDFGHKDLGFAKIDTHRELRTGYPEIIFCAGKTPAQVSAIVTYMLTQNHNILGTRADAAVYESVKNICPGIEYNPLAKTLVYIKEPIPPPKTWIAVVTAGTSDIPAAEEAAITAEVFGNTVKRYFDTGVAGVHRVYHYADELRSARVLIVAAGMEGALPSIVGGIVDKPVIALPTSVGYGASFGGIAALLGMLNSCASGVSVVNIDNGFGAGYLASMINKL